MAAPYISVVMPVYNRADFLREAIASVLEQRFDDFEVVVVDDGSTDGSAAIARGFGERVRVVVQPENGGAARARNRGIQEARGTWVCYADSDDLQLPHRLATLAGIARAHPDVGLVFSEFSTFHDGRVTEPRKVRRLKMGPRHRGLEIELHERLGPGRSCAALELPVPEADRERLVHVGHGADLLCLTHIAWGCASMYRRQAMLDCGGHAEDLRTFEDWQLSGAIALAHRIAFVDVPLVWYRVHPEQLTRVTKGGIEDYLAAFERVWLRDPGFRVHHPELLRRVHSLAHLQLGRHYAAERDWGPARRRLGRSLALWPYQRRAYLDLARATVRSFLPG